MSDECSSLPALGTMMPKGKKVALAPAVMKKQKAKKVVNPV